jgi:hypothetical protein
MNSSNQLVYKQMSKSRKHRLLKSILWLLVDEWGSANVLAAVRELEVDKRKSTGHLGPGRRGRPPVRARPPFEAILRSLDIAPDKREKLQRLAKRYRDRTFLPSMGDVRHFLSMHGDLSEFRDRTAAARRVLTVASQMRNAELDATLVDESFAGPSKLGPLADAIKEAGSSQRGTSMGDAKDASRK